MIHHGIHFGATGRYELRFFRIGCSRLLEIIPVLGEGPIDLPTLVTWFPESRRKAYYLMSIPEHLPPQARGTEGSGMDEGAGIGESRAEGWAGVRLCNLVAQGALTAEG